jgi:hypothetical protein
VEWLLDLALWSPGVFLEGVEKSEGREVELTGMHAGSVLVQWPQLLFHVFHIVSASMPCSFLLRPWLCVWRHGPNLTRWSVVRVTRDVPVSQCSASLAAIDLHMANPVLAHETWEEANTEVLGKYWYPY